MTTIHTAYGDGQIVEVETVRGRKSYKVAGYGFEIWLPEVEISKIAENLFSYGPMLEASEYGDTHIPGTPGHTPISGGGHDGSDAWGLHHQASDEHYMFHEDPRDPDSPRHGSEARYPSDASPTRYMFHEDPRDPDYQKSGDWNDFLPSGYSETEHGPHHQPDLEDNAYYQEHGVHHQAAGWHPPEHTPHDPDFDAYEEYGHSPEPSWVDPDNPSGHQDMGGYLENIDRHHFGASFDFEPSTHAWDNHTTLPYDWTPQFPIDMFRHEQTQSPDHEIDHDERMHSTDSRTGEDREDTHEYPGPNPDLFAKQGGFDDEPLHPHAHNPHPEENHSEDWPWPEDRSSWGDEPDHLDDYHPNGLRARPGEEEGFTHEAGHFEDHPEDYPYEKLAPGEDPFADRPHFQRQHVDPKHLDQGQDVEPIYGGDRLSREGAFDAPHLRPGEELHYPSGSSEGYDEGFHHRHDAPENDEAFHREWGRGHAASWERPAGLGPKFADIILDSADHFNDPVVRFQDDPVREIHRTASRDIEAGLDAETGEWMDLVCADKQIKTAAWKDVAKKAYRLKREGAVHVHAMDPSAVYASVDGDHGTYDVMILRGSAYSGLSPTGRKKQAIADWKCSCEWGKWAFKRKFTFVGRLCSHGYATYLTQQAEHMRERHRHQINQKRVAGVEQFKSWCDKENGGHIDIDAAENYLSLSEEEITREDAGKILDYVSDHHTEHAERDYDVKGYHYDNDTDVLQHTPGKLTPHTFVVPVGDYHEFEDLGDDRKTTGPGQIQANHPEEDPIDRSLRRQQEMANLLSDQMKLRSDMVDSIEKYQHPDPHQARVAKGEDKIKEHHPAFAWHMNDEPDFPEGGIARFSSLHLTADDNLLDKLRDLSREPYEPHRMEDHNHEVSGVVSELHDRGYAAEPLVAMRRAALWKTADDDPNRHGPGYIDPSTPAGGAGGGSTSPIGINYAGGPDVHGAGGPTSGLGILNKGIGDWASQTPIGEALGGGKNTPAAPAAAITAPGGGGGAGAPINQVTPGGGGVFTPDNPNAGTHGLSEQLPGPGGSGIGAGPGGTVGTGQGYGGAGFQSGGGWSPSQETTKIGPGAHTVNPGETVSDIQGRAGGGAVSGISGDLIHPGDKYTVGPGGAGGGGGGTAGGGWTAPKAAPAATTTGPAPGGGGSKGWFGGGGTASPPPAAPGAPGLGASPVGGSAGKPVKATAQHFAELYFQGADTGSGDDDNDPNKKNVSPSPDAQTKNVSPPSQGAGGQYKPVMNPGQSVNVPRPPGPGANPSLPGGASQAVPGDIHGPNAAATPGPSATTTSGAPGDPNKKQDQQQQQGLGGAAGGAGLGQALQMADMAEPLMSGVAGALPGMLSGAGGLGGAAGSIGSGLSGLGGGIAKGLGGLTKLLSHDPQRYAQLYFQGGAALDEKGGGDWMDFPFAGSGPDRQNWSGTSEHYVEDHEKPNRDDTWITNNDGKITKYKERPKQAQRFAERYFRADAMGNQMDAGYGNNGGVFGGGIVTPQGTGQGLGGSFTHAEDTGLHMGEPRNANLSHSAREFWADVDGGDAFSQGQTGYFNPDNPVPSEVEHDQPNAQPPNQGSSPVGPETEDVGASGLGEVAEAAPLVMGASNDIVRRFQASGGGCLGNDPGGSGGQYGDDAIAMQAQRMLRTAGRKYTPREEAELEGESHVLGARNLGDLDLTGTHYLED